MDTWNNLCKIIHVDMDAFYASVEQRDNPSLMGKPIVIGGNPKSRGVVSTASYEARKYGIHSAMPLSEALRRCPQAVFLPVNGEKYRQVSAQIHEIFLKFTPLVEPIALDEAFLDVTSSCNLFGSAEAIGLAIKEMIQHELKLTASVGLACNKFLAKLASDLHKPNGFVIIHPNRIQEILDPLPIEKIWGVGHKTAELLHDLNVITIQDLRKLKPEHLQRQFGVLGNQLYELARGIDNRPVENEREIKSVGREITFASDIDDRNTLETILLELACDIGQSIRKKLLKGRTITIKVRYPDFRTITRSRTLAQATNLDDDIYQEACSLLREISLRQPLRLIGITVHNLVTKEDIQLSLFAEETKGKEKLTRVIDALKDRFGEQSIKRARLIKRKRDTSEP